MSRFLIVLCVCLLASTFPLLAAAANGDSSDPILYISMHGGKDGVNNIYSYSLDGTLIQQDVLQGDANADEMRSGIILPDRTLLITNAHKTDSRIVQYSACDSNGNRQYVSDWATTNVAHPYGLASGLDAAAGDQVVWATNQDTFDLVQFGSHGTFQEQVKAFGSEEIRSIAYDEISNVLYVANENEDAVLAYNTKTSQWDSSLNFNSITDPIGLYIDPVSHTLFIGSNGTPSTVLAYNLDTRALVQTFENSGLQHPAGLVVYQDQLYVISQTPETLMQFNVTSGEYVGTPITQFDDTPEQIFFSPC